MPENLWEFTFKRTPSSDVTQAATPQYNLPTLTAPKGTPGGAYNLTGTGGGTIVNVRDGYLWTNSKPRVAGKGREEAPYVVMTERRVKANSMVAQALYSVGAVGDNIASALTKLGLTAGSTSQSAVVVGNELASLFQKATNAATEFLKNSLGIDKINSQSLQSFLDTQLNYIKDDPTFLTQDYLSWYKGLYITERTGWKFVLPYFEDYGQSVGNSWGSDSSSSGANVLTTGVAALAGEINTGIKTILGGLLNTSTGAYIENSQFYQFAHEGESVTIRFPLINTGAATYDDVVKHWQFIFLLLYNNKPERINRNLIEPPPIYETTIPGVKYMPFSYIKTLSVKYKGARRTMKINVPVTAGNSLSNASFNTTIETIVPEAYEIEITLQGLVTDSKNFMYSLIQDQSVNVTDISNRPTGTPSFIGPVVPRP